MSIAVKSGLPSLGSTEGAVISADEVSVSEDGSAAASVGEDLPRGKSAYEIAKENGFDGTEAEWLASLKGATGAAGANGKDGENGKTPYVGDNGNWYIGADDTGKPSRGAKGEPGADGSTPVLTTQRDGKVTYVKADGKIIGTVYDGIDPYFEISKVEEGEIADVALVGDYPTLGFNFTLPRGAKGDKGDTGATPNLTIGSVTTLDAGQNATASMGGTAESPVLNLGIPRGAKGDKGDTGATPNLTIGTVTTLDAGQSATASMGGTAESPVLSLGIPRGAKGEPGQGGAGAWYVTLTPNDDGSITADKTMAEIEAAYQAGYAVYCIYLLFYIFAVIPIIAPLTVHRANEQYTFCGVGTMDKLTSFQFELSKNSESGENKWTILQKEIPQGKIPTIVTSVSASSTNSEVPSAKAVYTFVTQKVGEIENGTY